MTATNISRVQSGFRLPLDSQRIAILGRTGSGKTLAGAWQLSRRSLDTKPWVILDYKRDRALNRLGAQELTIGAVPKRPGLYIIHPLQEDREKIDEFLWNVWEKGRIGLMFDEGYMVTGLASYRAILTQGRSKSIPVITLSQRPVWLDRFVFSESEFFQIFWLQDARDRKTVQAFLPFNINDRLPEYHSTWYDVIKDRVTRLAPVPDEETIYRDFRGRLGKQRRMV